MSSKENAGLANSEENELQHFEIQFLGLIQNFLKQQQFVIKNCIKRVAKSRPAAKHKVANTLGCSFT